MKFVIATGNAHKLTELQRILAPLGIEAVSVKELNVPMDDVEETGQTFEENALIKADAVCKKTGLPTIADDSGLCVEALHGAPGVYSARYAGEDATDKDRYEKLLRNMEGQTNRAAKFVCCVCCVWPDGRQLTLRGECPGQIGFAPQGENGFGYDPVFMIGDKSFAQLTADQKDVISHRGKALLALQQALQEQL